MPWYKSAILIMLAFLIFGGALLVVSCMFYGLGVLIWSLYLDTEYALALVVLGGAMFVSGILVVHLLGKDWIDD